MKLFSPKSFIYIALYASVGAAGFWIGHSTALSSAAASAKARATASAPVKNHVRTKGVTVAVSRSDIDKFLNAKGKPDAGELADWAKNLSPDECASYLAMLQTMPPGLQRDAVLNAIIGSWASQDPKGFLAETKGITGPRMKEQGVDAALKAWATQNPADALQWIKDNPGAAPSSALQARYLAAFAGYADADPQGAFTAANALDDTTTANQRLKNQALQAVMSSLADQGKFTDATGFIGQMPDGNLKNQAYANIANSWAQSNPQDASTWVASLTDPQMQANLGGQVAAQWAATDPTAAATWAAQMDAQAAAAAQANGTAAPTSFMLANAMQTWASYDLDSTGDFLNQLPASPDKDGAVATFALYAAQDDPASAMNWVNTISDPGMQNRLAMITALEWQQSDPTGYNQFITTTTVLSPDQIQALNNPAAAAIGNFLSGGFGGGGRGGFGGGGNGGGNGGAQANAGGIPPRLQTYIISGGAGFGGGGAAGAAGSGGGFANLLFGGGNPAAGNPTTPTQPANSSVPNANVPQTAPNIIGNLRQGFGRRGGVGGTGG
jgi:hypothetical protein